MLNFKTTIEIQAPAERVWAVMRDVERWSEWTTTVSSIKKMDNGPIKVGSRILIRQPKLPPAIWRVIELEEGKSFVSVTGSLLVRVTARHWLEPNQTGTQVTLSIQFSGLLRSLAARLTRVLNERYLTIEANGLKQRSENSIGH